VPDDPAAEPATADDPAPEPAVPDDPAAEPATADDPAPEPASPKVRAGRRVVPNPIAAVLSRPRRPPRPWSGLVIVLAMAAVVVVLVLAAYHGSAQTPPSDCARSATVLRRTDADAATARQVFSTAGSVPAADVHALQSDGDRLTAMVQGEPESDLAFDEKVLPLTDAITALVSGAGAHTGDVVDDLATLSSSASAAATFCGVGS